MNVDVIKPPADNEHTCTILGSAIDYVVQVVLGVLAFATLMAKWWMEGDGAGRRPFRVFALDTTKQSAGFFVAHIGNMVVASLLAEDSVSPCVWYFVNVLLDTTVRVLFAYLLLRLIGWVIQRANLDPKGLLDFGDYGDLYVLTCSSMKRWFFQLALWMGIVSCTVVMKGAVVWIFSPGLAAFGNWVMGPLESHTAEHGHSLELLVVMMIIPFVLSAVQLWIQDGFLRSKKRGQGLQRFTDQDLLTAERGMRGTAASPEPIFVISDALWGPDSHRQGRTIGGRCMVPVDDVDVTRGGSPSRVGGLVLPSTPSNDEEMMEVGLESD